MTTTTTDEPAVLLRRPARPAARAATGVTPRPERGTVADVTTDPAGERASDVDTVDAAAAAFASERPRLFGLAYRMLGSAAEAEDVLQDVWIRWQTADRAEIRNPGAFLMTVTTRLAINVLGSARVRRETYPGSWLPEPVDTSADPYLGAERADGLELAVLMLLERLTPAERAAYVLREAFDYGYDQVADVVGSSVVAARQLVSRARKHLQSGARTVVAPTERRRLLDAFVAAARAGDVARLESLFAADVVSWSDGGGLRNVSRIPVAGRERVAKFVRAFATRLWTGVEALPIEANGAPAVALQRDGVVFAVLSLAAGPDGIEELHWAMNPDKLAHVANQA